MLNYNKVMIAGRLTSNPELKNTESGKAVCSFDIAYNRDKNTAYYFTCVAWEAKAEFVKTHFAKGSPIFVEGELTQRKWKDNNGNNRSVIEVRVTEIKFVETLEERNAREGEGVPMGEVNPEPFVEVGIDDLPF